jgi:hypothetical protein
LHSNTTNQQPNKEQNCTKLTKYKKSNKLYSFILNPHKPKTNKKSKTKKSKNVKIKKKRKNQTNLRL